MSLTALFLVPPAVDVAVDAATLLLEQSFWDVARARSGPVNHNIYNTCEATPGAPAG
jgi:hypothetical protein